MATFKIQVDDANRRVVVRWEGVATLDDPVHQVSNISPSVPPGYGLLMDLTDCPSNVPLETNTKIASIRAKHTYPSAIVAPDPVTFGSCCQFAALVEVRGGGEVAVFKTVEEAQDWLSKAVDSEPPASPGR